MLSYSLIVPSVNRTNELIRLFESLARQTIRDFEVILVDQNTDARLTSIVEDFSEKFFINHIRTDSRGAARARNIGISAAKGEILLWPDDDCWYPSTILLETNRLFSLIPNLTGIIGILVDENGKALNRWNPIKMTSATLMDAFVHAREPTIILQKKIVQQVGCFDDVIGVGAGSLWGAGESTDLCVRLLKSGAHMVIDPSVQIFHPSLIISHPDTSQRHKAYTYARGMGGILKKNHLNLPFILSYWFTYLRAIVWNAIQFKWHAVGYHWARLKGVVEGWANYPIEADPGKIDRQSQP